MPDRIKYGLLADQTTAGGIRFGCALLLMGTLGLVASIVVVIDEGFRLPGIVLCSASLLLLLGGILAWAIWIRINRNRSFPMDFLGTDRERVLFGTCSLRWDPDEAEELEPGRYRLAEFSEVSVQTVPAEPDQQVTLMLFVSGGEKSGHFQVLGFGLRNAGAVLLEPSLVNVVALDGDEAMMVRDPMWGSDVPLLQGLHRIEAVIRHFPASLAVEVTVVPPTSPDTVFRTVMVGAFGRVLDAVTDEWTRRTVEKLLERDLVRDRETGESLMGFCREHGWGVSLSD
jgi:hypothetical protein